MYRRLSLIQPLGFHFVIFQLVLLSGWQADAHDPTHLFIKIRHCRHSVQLQCYPLYWVLEDYFLHHPILSFEVSTIYLSFTCEEAKAGKGSELCQFPRGTQLRSLTRNLLSPTLSTASSVAPSSLLTLWG